MGLGEKSWTDGHNSTLRPSAVPGTFTVDAALALAGSCRD